MELNAMRQHLSDVCGEAFRTSRAALFTASEEPTGRRLIFLGTGGNPVNVITQVRRTGGFVVMTPELRMHVDPGPGAIFHAARAQVPLDLLDAVYVSHGHTDHYLGAGAIIEAMCLGMNRRRGLLLAPESVLSGGQISAFHQGAMASPGYQGGPHARPLGPQLQLGRGATLTPVPVYHGIEDFGFVLALPELKLAYTSDTGYIEAYADELGSEHTVAVGASGLAQLAQATTWHQDLDQAMQGVDVLIANVSFFDMFAHRQLTVVGLRHLLERIRPRLCVMTHFDPSLGSPPERAAAAARWLEAETGVRTKAAEDGLQIDLSAL